MVKVLATNVFPRLIIGTNFLEINKLSVLLKRLSSPHIAGVGITKSVGGA